MSNKINLSTLDGLRGLSALYVMVSHAKWLLWEGFTVDYLFSSDKHSFLDVLLAVFFTSFFNHGFEAVLFFFVLSGFVIHLRYAKQSQIEKNHKFDLLPYLKRRFLRIYPPYFFAILLTIICDFIGISNDYGMYTNRTPLPNAAYNLNASYDVKTLIANLFFLMGGDIPIFGSNGPTWSLKFEWWFYLSYPILWVLTRHVLIAAIITTLISSLIVLLPKIFIFNFIREVFGMILVWWFGAILAEVYVGKIKWSYKHLSFFLLFVPFLFLFESFLSSTIIYEYMFGLSFMGLISLVFYFQEKGYEVSFLKKLKPLGDMSYTLYITHFPILILLNGYLTSINNGKLPNHFGFVFLGILFILSLAYLLHFVIEKPFMSRKVRDG